MKDLITQKEALIPLSLAESSEISLDLSFKSSDNGIFVARRSAAMLGLAISMGTVGMLFIQHKATATDSVPLRSTLPNVTIPLATPLHPLSNTPSSSTTIIGSIEVPILQSDLKPGELIQKQSETSPHSSKGILSANISPNQSITAKNTYFSSE